MAADRFDHLLVQPTAYDATLAFYRDVLGSGPMHIVIAEAHPAADRLKLPCRP